MSWKGIVLHHSADHDSPGLDATRIRQAHRAKGWRDTGYQWLIEAISGVAVAVMGRPMFQTGSHEPKRNADSLGVCFVGNFSERDVPKAHLEVGADLVAGLCVACGIEPSSSTISMHRHWKATECPGTKFPYDKFMGMVVERYGKREV